jgi:hypothetical protein
MNHPAASCGEFDQAPLKTRANICYLIENVKSQPASEVVPAALAAAIWPVSYESLMSCKGIKTTAPKIWTFWDSTKRSGFSETPIYYLISWVGAPKKICRKHFCPEKGPISCFQVATEE